MKDEDLIWEEISTEHIIRDEWIDFRRSAYRFPDGKIWQPYYSFTRRNYAVVVASDEEGRFICVRQFRQGIKQVTTEFPAGAIEQKDGEDPETAALRGARRELREETGYVSDCWRPLLVIPSNATISDNYAYLFAAENCRKVTGQELDAMELLRVETHTAEEIDAMLADGNFQQSVHALAWLLAKKAPGEA
ncbi:MAG: NUDIX hydrolase [Clostridia bacterium]|nr:NUDIX hydrolase [Clostridia bacterium]